MKLGNSDDEFFHKDFQSCENPHLLHFWHPFWTLVLKSATFTDMKLPFIINTLYEIIIEPAYVDKDGWLIRYSYPKCRFVWSKILMTPVRCMKSGLFNVSIYAGVILGLKLLN